MSGQARLPGGAVHKASQRQRRLAAPSSIVIERRWRPGNRVRWRDHSSTFLRETTVDGQAEVLIGARVYRVQRGELRLA